MLRETKEFCEKCKNNTFTVHIISGSFACSECHHNAYKVWNEDETDWKWEYDEEKRNGRFREQEEMTGSCRVGDAYGHGCVFLTCTTCNHEQNIPYAGEC